MALTFGQGAFAKAMLMLLIQSSIFTYEVKGQCSGGVCSPSAVRITRPVEDYNGTTGGSASFVCGAEGEGELSIHWNITGNSRPISSNRMVFTINHTGNVISSRLMIVSLSAHDNSSIVQCTVTQSTEHSDIMHVTSSGVLLVWDTGATTEIPPATFDPTSRPSEPDSVEEDESENPTAMSTFPPVNHVPDLNSGTVDTSQDSSEYALDKEIITAIAVCVGAILIIILSLIVIVILYYQYLRHKAAIRSSSEMNDVELRDECSNSDFPLAVSLPQDHTEVPFAMGPTQSPLPRSCLYPNPFLPLVSSHGPGCGESVFQSSQEHPSDATIEIEEASTSECAISSCHCQTGHCTCAGLSRIPYTSDIPHSLHSREHTLSGIKERVDRSDRDRDSTRSEDEQQMDSDMQSDACSLPSHLLLKHSNTNFAMHMDVTKARQKMIQPSASSSSPDSTVPFMDLFTIKCDATGGVYYNSVHGFLLIIPEGAVPNSVSVDIEIGVTLHGPFQFPEGKRPVSPIIWLCVQQPQNFKFLKSVELTLPHYLNVTTGQDMKIGFFKAGHDTNSGRYCFKPTEGKGIFNPHHNFGTLHTKHFCFQCIMVNVTPEDTEKANYCLVTVLPDPIKTPSWNICFCVAFLLPSCLEVVRRQFPEGYILSKMKFTFCSKPEGDGQLEICFQRKLPEGWMLARKPPKRISTSDVDFWRIRQSELELMEKESMYPPRFTIEVGGEEAEQSSTLEIHFEGAQEDIDTEIQLKHIGGGPRMHMLAPSSSAPSLASLASYGPPGYVVYPYAYSPFGTPPLHHRVMPVHPWALSGWDSVTSLPEDYPTDVELEEITTEIMGKLQHDYVKMKAYLEIPDDVMLEIEAAEPTLRRRICCMLMEWRKRSEDGSRVRLAERLRAADLRLHTAADKLLSGEYKLLPDSASSVSSLGSTGARKAIAGRTASSCSSEGVPQSHTQLE